MSESDTETTSSFVVNNGKAIYSYLNVLDAFKNGASNKSSISRVYTRVEYLFFTNISPRNKC